MKHICSPPIIFSITFYSLCLSLFVRKNSLLGAAVYFPLNNNRRHHYSIHQGFLKENCEMMGTAHINYALCSDHKLLLTTYREKDLKMLLQGECGRGRQSSHHLLLQVHSPLVGASDGLQTDGAHSRHKYVLEINILRHDFHKIVKIVAGFSKMLGSSPGWKLKFSAASYLLLWLSSEHRAWHIRPIRQNHSAASAITLQSPADLMRGIQPIDQSKHSHQGHSSSQAFNE